MADTELVTWIKRAAAATGANATLLLATSLVENGGQIGSLSGPSGLGDFVNGAPTSFGPFQFHIGGALGSNPPSWAFTYAAVLNRAQAFLNAGVQNGAGAAIVQGPADPSGYASKVNAQIPEAQSILASSRSNPTPGGQSVGQVLAALVGSQKGVPYSWDGGSAAGPTLGKADSTSSAGTTTVGFDCSGLVLWAAAQIGIVLPHSSAQQWSLGQPVAKNALQPGDVVFFHADSQGLPQHEGLYIGNGQFVAAPHTGADVGTFSLSTPAYASTYMGARRYTSNVGVDRNGADITAAKGTIVAPDSTQLGKAVASLTSHGGLASSVLGAAGAVTGGVEGAGGAVYDAAGDLLHPKRTAEDAASAAGDALGSAIGGVASDVESKVSHAFTWLALVGLAVGVMYLGLKRATGVDPIGAAASGLGAAGELAA